MVKVETMVVHTTTQSVETDAEPDIVVDLLADPRRIPEWALAFADEIIGDAEQGWQVIKDGQAFDLQAVVSRPSRTVDYLRQVAPGRTGGAYLRVLPRPSGGSVVVMTLPVTPGADPDAVAATLRDELAALTRLAQGF